MLANRISRIRAFKPRFSSTLSQPYPFSNLRAYPFKLSSADAVLHMAPYASFVTLFKGIFSSLGARFLPGFGFQPLQPTRIQPVYFPAWIIDAELELEISYGSTQRASMIQAVDSYLPGCDFRVLSSAPLLSRPIKTPEAIPFTEELRHQYDTEVLCLPYNISPFTALDVARRIPTIDARVDDAFSFTPKSITSNLFAAYPVLIPLYLASYDFTIPGTDIPRSLTMFIEAYTPKGRIMADRHFPFSAEETRQLMPNAPKFINDFAIEFEEPNVAFLRGEPQRFIRMAGLMTPERHNFADMAVLWLEDLLTSHGTATRLASMSNISDVVDDPRVREYTHEERVPNASWIRMGAEITSYKMIAESLAKAEPRVISMGIEAPEPEKLVDGAVNSLTSRIDTLQTKRAQSLPSWWREMLENAQKK